MAEFTPVVSIGMPCFNAAGFISDSIQSILKQTFSGFELIISDNGSSDGTFDVAKSFAEKDPRIRLMRNPFDIGAVSNFARVFEQATGKYFMWAADHDLWHESFVRECVSHLEAHSGVVSCFSSGGVLDESGSLTGELAGAHPFPDDPLERFLRILRWDAGCHNLIYSLFRRTTLADCVPLPRPLLFWDVAVMARIAWKGQIAILPDRLYFKRENHGTETAAEFYKRCVRYMKSEQPLLLPGLFKVCLETATKNTRGVGRTRLAFRIANSVLTSSTLRRYLKIDAATLLNRLTGSLLGWDNAYAAVAALLRLMGRPQQSPGDKRRRETSETGKD